MSTGAESSLSRAVVALLLVGALVTASGLAISVLASGAGGGGLTEGSGSSGTGGAAVQQQNPDEVEGEGSLSAVERQLADRVAGQVRSGEIDFDQDRIDEVRGSLEDSEYSSLLDRYSDVAGETGNDNRSQVFLSMRDNQREYARAVDVYWRYYRLYNGTANVSAPEYQKSLERLSFVSENVSSVPEWNQTERRALARQMEARWRRANQSSASLITDYRKLAELDGTDYSGAIQSVRTSRQNVSETHEAVRRAEFTVVDLTASTNEPTGSFTDPIPITGRLTLTNGTALPDQSVRIKVHEQLYRTRTNDTGHYELSYHPATLPLDATTARVRFIPENSSDYVAASPSNVSLQVEQVEPELSVEVQPGRAGFNETLEISGRVGSGAVGAQNVSYLVSVGNTFLAANETKGTGTFSVNASLPATVPVGENQVRVSLPGRNRALAPTNVSAKVRVRERSTQLAVKASQIDGRTFQVSGRLAVPDGTGVPEQQVQLLAKGTELETATTGLNGSFATTVVVPKQVLESGLFEDTVTFAVEATYQNKLSNLGSSREQTTTHVVTGAPGGWIVGVLLLVVVFSSGYSLYRRWRQETGDQCKRAADLQDWNAVWDPTAGMNSGSNESLLKLAQEQLSDDRPNVAIQLGYAAVRRRLERQFNVDTSTTPWEFYRACRQDNPESDVLETLRQVTELYERAVFASESVSTEAVGGLLTSADEAVNE